jgi:uncharacterized membrane protein YdjX (TVP38/TMEM64 family)
MNLPGNAFSTSSGGQSMADGESSSLSSPRSGGGVGRILLVGVVLLAAAAALHLTPLHAYLSDAQRLRGDLLRLGAWVYPLTVIGVALVLACGMPRLPIHAAGGMIFGFWTGLVLTLLGAILGHYVVFLFIRWGGREWVLQRWPALRKWADLIHDRGVIGVLLVRQLPAHSMVINTALALSNVSHRDFLAGTALGLLPEAIPATLIGAGLMRASLRGSTGYFALAAAAFALIWIGGGYTLRTWHRHPREQP